MIGQFAKNTHRVLFQRDRGISQRRGFFGNCWGLGLVVLLGGDRRGKPGRGRPGSRGAGLDRLPVASPSKQPAGTASELLFRTCSDA